MCREELLRKIAEQKELGGINVACLDVGTKIEVTTRNSVYKMELLGGKCIGIEGGYFSDEKIEAQFIGSNWGGNACKMNWIGKGMQMEIHYYDFDEDVFDENPDPNRLLTSTVQKAKVIGDNWTFELWD